VKAIPLNFWTFSGSMRAIFTNFWSHSKPSEQVLVKFQSTFELQLRTPKEMLANCWTPFKALTSS
jgi:hypothetical protein